MRKKRKNNRNERWAITIDLMNIKRITKEYYGQHYFPTILGKMDKLLERHNLLNSQKKYKTSKGTYQLKELNQ